MNMAPSVLPFLVFQLKLISQDSYSG